MVSFLKKTALLAASLILTMALAEGISRIFVPSWAPAATEHEAFWKYDSLLGWSQPAGTQGIFRRNDFSVRISINSLGMRDTEYSIARIPGKKRMLILGDSFGWGYGVEREDIFHEIIEQRHRDWEILNASVSGYSTDQEYLYYRMRGERLQPDIVLLVFTGNDFEGNRTSGSFWYSKPFFLLKGDSLLLQNTPVPSASLVQRINRAIVGNTYFLSKLFLITLPALREIRSWFRYDGVRDGGNDTGEEPTGAIMHALQMETGRSGARLITVSAPMEEDLSARIRRICEKESIPLLQLDSLFRNHPEYRITRDEHWNAGGHYAVSAVVDSFLQLKGMIE